MGILSTIFSSGASKLVESVTNGLDNLITNKEELAAAKLAIDKEVNRHMEAIEANTSKELELQLKDVADARNREIQIVTSDKAPLINKIIQPILAILILGSCFIFWYLMLYVDIPKDKEVQIAGVTGALTTLSMGVVSFFFGSSSSSAAKQKQLDKMFNEK
jgi:hypothetical protein